MSSATMKRTVKKIATATVITTVVITVRKVAAMIPIYRN